MMKLKLTDLIDLPWDKLKVQLCKEIRAALGETGPWDYITDPPEVVAERLMRIGDNRLGPNILTRVCRALDSVSQGDFENDVERFAWWLLATPIQRILVCLLALGKIEE
jgi:hypothetical protein